MARLSRSVLVMSLLAVSCGGGGDSSPPSSPPPTGSGDTITGRERFGWTQTASASDAATLQFAAYVDGVRRVLEGATCTAATASTLECSAPLPSMSAGRHTLELAAFFPSGDGVVESPRSAALQLNVAGVTASAAPISVAGGSVLGSDGRARDAEILGSDLLDPIDVAVDWAGRSFVAERAGAIRIFDRDGSNSDGDVADDLSTSRDPDTVLLSLALAPDFEQSRLLYVLKAEPAGDEARALVVRYREVNGRLGQAAVLATATVAGVDPSGVIRFGPDGALYVGLGSRSGTPDSDSASRDGGRILRLLPDGRTPRDNPSASPVYSTGHRDPIGFAWQRAQRTFWEVESGVDADEVNAVRAGADYGWPALSGRDRVADATAPSVLLPAGTMPSGMTAIDDQRGPGDGDLIVASTAFEDLLQIDITPEGQAAGEPTRLLERRFGAIGQVTSRAGGLLYFITRNRETWGAGHDVLVRLSPPATR